MTGFVAAFLATAVLTMPPGPWQEILSGLVQEAERAGWWACHPPGACDSHGRCWSHSHWAYDAQMWAPHVVESMPQKRNLHRALLDLGDSIAMARHLRAAMVEGLQ